MSSDVPPAVLLRVRDPDADAAALEALTAGLRRELLELDVDDVSGARAETPAGARAGEMLEIGTLLVSGVTTPALIGGIVATVRAWLGYQARREVEVVVGDTRIVLKGPPTPEQQRIVDELIGASRDEPP